MSEEFDYEHKKNNNKLFLISIFLTNCFVTTQKAACEYEYENFYKGNCELSAFLFLGISSDQGSQNDLIVSSLILFCLDEIKMEKECKNSSNFLPFPHPM